MRAISNARAGKKLTARLKRQVDEDELRMMITTTTMKRCRAGH